MRDAIWAAAFTRDIVAGERPTLFKRLGGTPGVSAHVAAGTSPLHYDLYVVPGRPPGAAVVVAHGFTHEGTADPRLRELCRRLARAGFVVMAPAFDEMRRYQLGLGDTAALELAVETIAAHPGVVPSRVCIAAFSFGAAPSLIALSREPLKSRVAAAMIFGGFFDLHRTLRYVLTGAYEADGVPRQAVLPTAGDDRWKFLRANVEVLPPSGSRPAFLAALDGLVRDAAQRVEPAGWSEPEQAMFALFANRDPARFDGLYAAVAPHVDGWVRRLSPCEYAGDLTTPLLIVHSRTDPKTSYTESVAMSRGVPHAPPPHLAVLNTFSHVDLALNWRSLRAIATDVVPGLLMIWGIGRWLLRVARHGGSQPVSRVSSRLGQGAPSAPGGAGHGGR